MPHELFAEMGAFSGDRMRFIARVIAAARKCDLLLIGHINLLPIAAALKVANPSIRSSLFVHGDEVWNGTARGRRFYEPALLRCVDVIASVSHYTAAVMAREFGVPPAKFQIFPNAVDTENHTLPRSDRGARAILTVTRLGAGDRRKNIDALIRAISLLKSQGRAALLEVIGDGALRLELEALAAELGVTDEVKFLGRVSDADLRRAYDRASAFVLPSSKEGFGIVYLEAWLHALPVICGREGASHEVVSDGVDGFVCDEHDPAHLAEKIDWLLSNPYEASAMGHQGFIKTHAQYTNARAEYNLQKLLNQLSFA
jgi:glycosyltransferase involved in cell wall biosynthesis